MSRLLRTALAAALVLAGLPPRARADEAAQTYQPPASPNPQALLNPTSLFGSNDAVLTSFGVAKLDGAWYLQIRPSIDLNLGKVALGFHLPVNLLSPYPAPPQANKDDTYGHVLRKSDWPRPDKTNIGQYFALIHLVRYGNQGDPLFVQYGLLGGQTIGHGSIVDRYSNALNPDQPKAGLQVGVDSKWGGAEALVDNVDLANVSLAVGRAYVRPFSFMDGSFIGDRLAVGFTLAVDPNQAITNLHDITGASVKVYGGDVEFRVLRNPLLDLVPYLDVNRESVAITGDTGGTTSNGATGMHLGAKAAFHLGSSGLATLYARAEYQLMQAGYIPEYFGPGYDVDRRLNPTTGNAAMPRAVLLQQAIALAGPLQNGLLGEVGFSVAGMVNGGATLTAIPGTPNSGNLLLFASLPGLSLFKANVYYLRSNFEQLSDIWHLNAASILEGVVLVPISGPLYASAIFQRHWVEQADGTLTASNDFNVGVQLYFGL